MKKKKAYFNSTDKYIEDPYDMGKWNYVSKIIAYDSQRLGSDKSLDYHSYVNIKDSKELEKFRLWYNSQRKIGEKMSKLKKISREQYGASGIGIYPTETGATFDESDPNLAKAERYKRRMQYQKQHGSVPERNTKEEEARINKNDLSKRMNKYIILLQKSLMSNDEIDLETFQDSLRLLNGLAEITKKIRTAEMGIDLMYRTSKRLGKCGLKKEAASLKKFAQQQEQDMAAPQPSPAPEQAEPQIEQELPPGPPIPLEQQVETQPSDPNLQALDAANEAEPVKFSDIETDGPSDGEYDKIMSDSINMMDAADKLEDVASMLADRRVIRFLAEFDIMLDKLGVASMFPELAESQSKLIDAYSYALTRGSKMMGQLANAAEILKGMETKLPGSDNVDTE